jgi:hypothetical protein
MGGRLPFVAAARLIGERFERPTAFRADALLLAIQCHFALSRRRWRADRRRKRD